MSWKIEKTIGEILAETAARAPSAPAVMDMECRYSYGELHTLTDRIAAGLLSRGIRKGTHVGICSGDYPVTLMCFYALWKLGAVVIPMCTTSGGAEILHYIDIADMEYVLIGDRIGIQEPEALCRSSRRAPHLLNFAGAEGLEILCAGADSVSPERLAQVKAMVQPGDLDTFLFTSGTTGASKPVMTTHFSRVNTMFAQARAVNAVPQDRFCSVLPMYHCFSLTASVLAAMSAGACVCFPADRHGHTVLKTIETLRCTVLTAVPTLYSTLLRRKDEGDYDLSSLRVGVIGGSAYSSQLYCAVCEKLQITLLPSLGQTEATAGITICGAQDSAISRMRTVGRFFPHLEGCVQSEQGEILPSGAQGEICVRGYNVMRGYYNMPEETAQVIDPAGWLHTGDFGTMDDDGYVYYLGRKKEIVIRGGENIAPIEIEQLLAEDDRIEDVKVIGVPDPHFIEELCACVVCEEPLTADEVRDILRPRLAYFKIPRYVIFPQQLPVNAAGKVDLRKLRQLAMDELELTGISGSGDCAKTRNT